MLSGDVPWVGWRAVIISEVIFLIFFIFTILLAITLLICLSSHSKSQARHHLVITVVSIGRVVRNTAVLLVLFLVFPSLGPILDSCCVRFGAVVASVAHILGTNRMTGFFKIFCKPSGPSHVFFCLTLLNLKI